MKRRIPNRNRDLRRYVLRRRILQLTGYALWLAAFGFGAWFYNDSHRTYPPERRIVGWRLALWMLAAAVAGFFLFRLWRFFTQRGIEGAVVESGLSHSYTASADPGAGNPVNYDFRLNTYLVIRDKKGKRRRLRFEQKSGFYLYYYEGNSVCRLSGLPYPIRDPGRICRPPVGQTAGTGRSNDDLSGGYLCAACGNLNNRNLLEPCGRCGLSLVDPAELWQASDAVEKG